MVDSLGFRLHTCSGRGRSNSQLLVNMCDIYCETLNTSVSLSLDNHLAVRKHYGFVKSSNRHSAISAFNSSASNLKL